MAAQIHWRSWSHCLDPCSGCVAVGVWLWVVGWLVGAEKRRDEERSSEELMSELIFAERHSITGEPRTAGYQPHRRYLVGNITKRQMGDL